MKAILIGFSLAFASIHFCAAQVPNTSAAPTPAEQEVLDLSKNKWQWMVDKKVDTLNQLFDDKVVFVHMIGSWGKAHELDVMKTGMISYKKVEIYSAGVNIFGNTAILLNDIDMVTVVGGKEGANPFVVTEVYIRENGKWKLASLAYSHLLRPVKLNDNKGNQQQQ